MCLILLEILPFKSMEVSGTPKRKGSSKILLVFLSSLCAKRYIIYAGNNCITFSSFFLFYFTLGGDGGCFGYEQALSWKKQWQIYQGESSEKNNFLCNVQRSNALQMKNNLDVHLAGSYLEDGPDFHVTGSFTSMSFKVWKGNSVIAEVCKAFSVSIIAAVARLRPLFNQLINGICDRYCFCKTHCCIMKTQVMHNYTWGSCMGKESFKLKVYPEVDYAFILALTVIMHETDKV